MLSNCWDWYSVNASGPPVKDQACEKDHLFFHSSGIVGLGHSRLLWLSHSGTSCDSNGTIDSTSKATQGTLEGLLRLLKYAITSTLSPSCNKLRTLRVTLLFAVHASLSFRLHTARCSVAPTWDITVCWKLASSPIGSITKCIRILAVVVVDDVRALRFVESPDWCNPKLN